MKFIIDEYGFYKGFGGSKTVLAENETEVSFPPEEGFVKPQWNGSIWVEGATEEEIIEVRVIPEQVPVWCIKVILHEMGLLTTVEAALNQLEEPSKTRANYIWNFGNFILRDSLTVAFIGQVLQKNKQEIDEIFINANNIEL